MGSCLSVSDMVSNATQNIQEAAGVEIPSEVTNVVNDAATKAIEDATSPEKIIAKIQEYIAKLLENSENVCEFECWAKLCPVQEPARQVHGDGQECLRERQRRMWSRSFLIPSNSLLPTPSSSRMLRPGASIPSSSKSAIEGCVDTVGFLNEKVFRVSALQCPD